MTTDDYKLYTEKGYFTVRRSDKFWNGVFSDQTIEQYLMRQLKTFGGMTRGRGITDSTLTKLVHAIPRCVPICTALENLTTVQTSTSDQHVITQLLEAHPPFADRDPDVLVNIATGVVADISVNCDNAVQIGESSMKQMTGNTFSDITLRRKDRVKSIAAMKNTVTIRGEDVVVNPDLLFNRIKCILNTSSELDTFLRYELAPQPPSLFVDGQMRKTAKSSLGTVMKSLVSGHTTIPDDATFVRDGGLHSVVWPQPATYKDVSETYTRYVLHHYTAGATVEFDGYNGSVSTKSAEQARRSKLSTYADIMLSPNVSTTTSQTSFLGNGNNKNRLIQSLTPILENDGITAIQAESDADTLIVETALEISTTRDGPVIVVGTDTYLLVMLVARAPATGNLYMLCEGKQAILFSIRELQDALGTHAQRLLFIDAISGCDTMSALYNQGKRKARKIARSTPDLDTHMDVFNAESSTHEEVSVAGEKFILALYGAEKFTTLDKYRHIASKRRVANTSLSGRFQLLVSSLPPTSAAARQHSYRVYLQVQEWMGHKLNPVDWGWQTDNQTIVPVPTNQPVAPQTLVNFVTCGCKSGCGKACGCRKAGMACSKMCVNCMCVCFNAPEPDTTEDNRHD